MSLHTPTALWQLARLWTTFGLLCSAIGCFEYESRLVSNEAKDDLSLEDPSAAPDPTEPDPTEPDESDSSDESGIFDTWEDDPSFIFDECEVTCTAEGPVCDFESCRECTGCCDCGILGNRESVCTERDNSVLYCNDGCLEREPCPPDEVCTPDFVREASCEPCIPCSEPGESYCDVSGEEDRAYRCNENLCLVEERCGPGSACMYSRRAFGGDFGGQCTPIFQNCNAEFCSGFRFCGEDDEQECGPCGCCEFNDERDLCMAGPDGTYVLRGISSFECYEVDVCGPERVCELTPNGEAAYCAGP